MNKYCSGFRSRKRCIANLYFSIFSLLIISSVRSGAQTDPCFDLDVPVFTYGTEGTKIAQTFHVDEGSTLRTFFFSFPCPFDNFWRDVLGQIRILETEDGVPTETEIAHFNLEPDVLSFLGITPVYFETGGIYALEVEIFDFLPEQGVRFEVSHDNPDPDGAMWVKAQGEDWEAVSIEGTPGVVVDMLLDLDFRTVSPVIVSVSPEPDSHVVINEPITLEANIGPGHLESVESVTFSVAGEVYAEIGSAPYSVEYIPTEIGELDIFIGVNLNDGRQPAVSYKVTVEASPPPSNDDYADATIVSGSLIEIETSNSGATREFDEVRFGSNQGKHSIWYEWTAPFDGICVIGGQGHDWTEDGLLLTLYAKSSSRLGDLVVSNGSDGPDEVLEFQVFEGSTYLISVDSYFDEYFGDLTWSLRLRPENDLFENRTYFQTDRVSLIGNNIGSSKEGDEQGPQDGKSVWFSWQPSVSSKTTISIASDSFDYWLAVYEGNRLDSLGLVASLQGSSGSARELAFEADPRTVYSIQIAGVDGQEGEFQLSIDQSTVRIISPVSDSLTTLGSSVAIQALPFNDSGNVSEVRFYANDEFLGTANQSPYVHEWSGAALGSYLLHVESVLNDGTMLRSPTVSMLVHEQNELPEPRIFTGGFRYPEVYVINATGTTFHWGGLVTRRDVIVPPSDPFASDWRLIPASAYYRHFLPQRTDFPFDNTDVRKIVWSTNTGSKDKEAWALLENGKLFRRGLPDILPEHITDFQGFAEHLATGQTPEVEYFKSNYENGKFRPDLYVSQEWTESLMAGFCRSITDHVIYGSNIYNSDEIQILNLSPATRRAIADDYDISLINRLILDDLFPEFILPLAQWREVQPLPGSSNWIDVCSGSGIFAVNNNGGIIRFSDRGTSQMNTGLSPITSVRVKAITGLGSGLLAAISEDNKLYTISETQSPIEIPLSGFLEWSQIVSTRNNWIYLLSDEGILLEVKNQNGWGIKEIPPLDGATGWTRVAAGGLHVLAIANNGQLYSWGFNEFGQLGNGLNFAEYQNQPSAVPLPPGVNAWMAIAASETHSMAIGDDCRLYTWGGNESGVLGVGTYPDRLSPKAVLAVNSLCGIPVVFTDSERSVLPDGRFMIEFRSDLNRSYTIQYSDDAEIWESSFPPILGNGELVQWIDGGPPVTRSLPSENTSRLYRVVLTP